MMNGELQTNGSSSSIHAVEAQFGCCQFHPMLSRELVFKTFGCVSPILIGRIGAKVMISVGKRKDIVNVYP
jgi:hypothetical protein